MTETDEWIDQIHHTDARDGLAALPDESIGLSFWSPPYYIGDWMDEHSFGEWKALIRRVIAQQYRVMAPGSFVVINIADTLAFPDPEMPQVQVNNRSGKRVAVTKEDIEDVLEDHPDWTRYELADYFNCSEQTIQRRLEGVNVRGGKHDTQTKVKLVGGLIEDWAEDAGFYLYDRRVWVKDPAWKNSQWHTHSYRSVDEFEYLYVLWKPGEMDYDRNDLSSSEWSSWGSRGVWSIRSVEQNEVEFDHLKKFPAELARRVIRLFSDRDDVVLDPFAGSGTTCRVAIEQGREHVGFEINEETVVLARDRCESASQNSSMTTVQKRLGEVVE